jgi:acetyltransferase
VQAHSAKYPSQWTRAATTRDGVRYTIRPIRTEDAERERTFIVGLSPETRYSRMMFTMSEPSPELVERFVQVDYHHSMAFLALVGKDEHQRIMGVARYALDGERGYEFAVVIGDEWQARGIATSLSRLLLDYARTEGIRALNAKILVTNQRMIDFARRLGMSVCATPGDPMVLTASMDL